MGSQNVMPVGARAAGPIGPVDDGVEDVDRRFRLSATNLALIATAVGLVPFVVLLVRLVAAGQVALHGDDALIELRVRDVGSTDTPLLGSYQRFGFHMPGPLLLYLLAPLYRLSGSDFVGLQIGALCINAVAFVGTAITVLKRLGAVPAIWAVLVLSVLVQALGPVRMSDPWEPRVTVLPFVFFLVLTAALASGAARAMPAAASVATLLAQAYANLAPVVAVLLLAGGTVFLVQRARARPPARLSTALRDARRPVLVTLAVLAVLWLPPLVHELSGRPSNVGRILSFIRRPGPGLGLSDAASALALQTDHRAGWITGETPITFATGAVDLTGSPAVPMALVVLVIATAVSAVRRDRSALLGATVLLGFSVGLVVLSRLVGGLYDWILMWTWGLGTATWLAVGVCAWRSFPGRERRSVQGVAAAVLGIGVCVMVAVSVGRGSSPPEPDDRTRSAVLAVADDAEEALDGVDGPVLVRSELEIELVFGDGDGAVEPMALLLERAGFEVRVEPHLGLKFGDHRTRDDAVVEVVLVGVEQEDRSGLDGVVATVATRTPEEEAELERLAAELPDGLVDDEAAMDEVLAGPRGLLQYSVGRYRELRSYQPMSLVVRPLEP